MRAPDVWSPKWLGEALAVQSTHTPEDLPAEVMDALAAAMVALETVRPVGPNGKHDARHTPWCGCVDPEWGAR